MFCGKGFRFSEKSEAGGLFRCEPRFSQERNNPLARPQVISKVGRVMACVLRDRVSSGSTEIQAPSARMSLANTSLGMTRIVFMDCRALLWTIWPRECGLEAVGPRWVQNGSKASPKSPTPPSTYAWSPTYWARRPPLQSSNHPLGSKAHRLHFG